jgi:hypothetical protein
MAAKPELVATCKRQIIASRLMQKVFYDVVTVYDLGNALRRLRIANAASQTVKTLVVQRRALPSAAAVVCAIGKSPQQWNVRHGSATVLSKKLPPAHLASKALQL